MRTALLKFMFILLCHSVCAQAQLYSIYFLTDKAEVPTQAALELMRLSNAQQMDSIIIHGHCDSIGSVAYNKSLSMRRVNAVKTMLCANGVQQQQIKVIIGYGELKPLASNGTEEGRQTNRRVDVYFYGNGKAPAITSSFKGVSDNPNSDPPKPKPAVTVATPTTNAVELQQLKKDNYAVGDKLSFPGLQFRGGEHHLVPTSEPLLDEIAAMLKKHPKVKVEVQGHVCCVGPYDIDGIDIEYNTQNLSQTRAQEIVRLLVNRGIERSRLVPRGYGGTRKISPIENTEQQKASNRRVELQVIE